MDETVQTTESAERYVVTDEQWKTMRSGISDFPVTKQGGAIDKVHIYPIDLGNVETALKTMNDPLKFFVVITRKTDSFARDVRTDSVYAVQKAGLELNRPFLTFYGQENKEISDMIKSMFPKLPGAP